MLGEAAMTAGDAARYYRDYENAIHAIGKAAAGRGVYRGPGISIKLSALHPRYARAQADRVMSELLPRVKALAALAKSYDIGLNIDAEEADRVELSLDLLESLSGVRDLAGWHGLGFVVQAYCKRCPFVIDWIVDLARRSGRRIMVRLVKGAYWDSEIKRAQVAGLAGFPVYTRKVHTDVAYIACARKLLAARDLIFPQFATHNAQTLSAIHHMAGPDFTVGDWEFQCLHGMGEPLYEEVVAPDKLNRPCRIYAPVGTHETLLAYLVRRLLENGANSSFVHRISDPSVSIDELAADPADIVRSMPQPGAKHDRIALPRDILGARVNSSGLDLSDESVLAALSDSLALSATLDWQARPLVAGLPVERFLQPLRNPADHRDVVGHGVWALESDARRAARIAAEAASGWAATPVEIRAACLERAADAMQARMPTLLGLIVREAGKSLPNAIAEVREAVDFLRYYAAEARRVLNDARPLGPVVCISPWNFPLAIFTGQVSAALAAGNPVLAKPAEETPLIAAEAVRILHAAGIPEAVLQFLPGDGAIGAALVAAPETAGVMFTGSTEVARLIQGQLAGRLSPDGKPIPLVAETGGQNAMIVDSSALAEQVVADVIASAFDSAGQRCSALRILCLQEEIADRTLAMLNGALAELRIGPTDRLAADIGPVITAEAKAGIERHIEAMRAQGRAVEQTPLSGEAAHGTFIPPTIIEIERIADVTREIFGPVLHVMRYRRDRIDRLIADINATGYGLTFGLHTRLDETVAHVTRRIRAGNLYINRNIIGAVVGVQPFGGHGLSGTGPKAGGPLYLTRLVRDPIRPFDAAAMKPDPALATFASWLETQGEAEPAMIARGYGQLSPLGAEMELPGPVGERNVYRLRPRGTILLRPVTRAGLFNQIAAVLATGNDAILDASAASRPLLDALPPQVAARVRQGNAGEATGALIEGDASALASIRPGLAERPGPLIIIQAATTGQCMTTTAYRLEWLVEEVSTAINTAAAGGNASLITMV
jgi:RHH-type proline utilization regulon transcriptional repressor/proline dehydrogenase/delta 1-pyrroline-5-carboxylate dehydrogenase